jgi:hypothetical protein
LVRINGLSDTTFYTINIVTRANNYNVTGRTLDTVNYLHSYYNFVDISNNHYKNMVDNSYNLRLLTAPISISTDLNGLPSNYNSSNFKYVAKISNHPIYYNYNVKPTVNEISVGMWVKGISQTMHYDFNIVQNDIGHVFRIEAFINKVLVSVRNIIYTINNNYLNSFINWTHICVTVRKNGIYLVYINGNLIYISTNILVNTYFFNNQSWRSDYNIDTNIGPIITYSTCLTSDQVSNIYN